MSQSEEIASRNSEYPPGSLPGSEIKSGAGRELAGGITPFQPFREAIQQAEGEWSVRRQCLTLNPLQYPPGGTSGVKEHSTSPKTRTQMVLPVKELPHFEGTKREDGITFIQHVYEIAQGACWMDKEWVLTKASIWKNSFGCWRINQVNLQRQQNL
jgi:hypothetical protein